MILADTSIWVDFLGKRGDSLLERLLENEAVVMHPFIIAELALGSLNKRELLLRSLAELPQTQVASIDEVMRLLHEAKLYGIGIGFVDLHLLASILLSKEVSLWTRDKRLREACLKANAPLFSTH
jgi:predicted nucleic acid-binding protein